MYGSGTPLWGKGENLSSPQQQHQRSQGTQMSTSYQNQSYQQGSSAYQPPNVDGKYAQQQTGVIEDTLRTQYESEGQANTVLSQLTTQRYQLKGAHDNVWKMRETTEQAKRQLQELISKNRRKKRRLQVMVAMLGFVDLVLFLRLIQCGGSFFCRSRY